MVRSTLGIFITQKEVIDETLTDPEKLQLQDECYMIALNLLSVNGYTQEHWSKSLSDLAEQELKTAGLPDNLYTRSLIVNACNDLIEIHNDDYAIDSDMEIS